MDTNFILEVGDVSDNGQVTIVDEDRLCYLVRSESHGAIGLRTISKAILSEFVQYLEQHPESNANQARDALSGTSDIDKFEYGYASTLTVLAKMALQYSKVRKTTSLAPVSKSDERPLQQIFYGAPGTGKSNTIKREVDQKGFHCIRTTFHPDSDYSTFVGAYKPTSVEEPVMTVIGTKAVPVENPDGTHRIEKRINYEFVPQAFLKAYTSSWKNPDAPFFLIIEEINRGNCAQIFGDLFQLLDRSENGESEYSIVPDEDIQKFLLTDKKYGFASIDEDLKRIIPKEVYLGELMILPSNLYIWATMNTSDQSLFPIDSAFKRRWDWSYVPIANARKGWHINVNGKRYDWWDFLVKINTLIGDTTNSEDKKLGYFFCKTENGIIDAETFVGKVIFYLWNDVFKDFEFDGDVFVDTDDETKLTFDKFYKTDEACKTSVREDKVDMFLTNLGVKFADDDEDDEDNQGGRTRYLINGDKFKRKSYFGKEIMMQYLKLHPNLTFQEIKNIFPDSLLGDDRQHRGLIASIETPLGSYQRYYSPETFTSFDGVSFCTKISFLFWSKQE